MDNRETKLIFVQGSGGSGKTTLAKKILAYARGKGMLSVGCASTALAATNYDKFDTAHGLFKYPVIEEDDKENDVEQCCKLNEHPQRLELLQSTNLIVWDEFPSNHRNIFETIYQQLNRFRDKVVLCMGDFRQIAPVITNGERADIVNVSIITSYLWAKFTILNLSINMRLAHQNNEHDALQQRKYAEFILAIGEGYHLNINADLQDENLESGEQTYIISNIPYLLEEQHAINYIYPNGIMSIEDEQTKIALLAVTNNDVDSWNYKIQQLNPNEKVTLLSKDILCEVDDPHGILHAMLTEDVLNQFNKNSVPPHELNLKQGDICILTRNIAKREGLTNNARVKIIRIQQYCISVSPNITSLT